MLEARVEGLILKKETADLKNQDKSLRPEPQDGTAAGTLHLRSDIPSQGRGYDLSFEEVGIAKHYICRDLPEPGVSDLNP